MKRMEPVLTSRQNPLVREAASLHDKKNRDEMGAFLLEGEKLVTEAADGGLPVVRLYVAQSRAEALLPVLQTRFSATQYADLPVYILQDDCFEKISSEKAPQGVIAFVKSLDFFKRTIIIYDEDVLSLRGKRVLLLYALQDPGNLGAVIRSAVAFHVDTIILSADCADLYNSKTIRAAMGCLFRVNCLVVSDFSSAVRALRASGRRVLAAELREKAVPLGEISLSPEDCLLIGNEGHGIPAELSSACTGSVYLPISQKAESLNAAVAAAIFLWEQDKA